MPPGRSTGGLAVRLLITTSGGPAGPGAPALPEPHAGMTRPARIRSCVLIPVSQIKIPAAPDGFLVHRLEFGHELGQPGLGLGVFALDQGLAFGPDAGAGEIVHPFAEGMITIYLSLDKITKLTY